jgi:hypothetical protein
MPEGQSGAIVSIENRVANSSLGVHIAMVDRSDKAYFWSLEGVVSWELRIEQE